MFCQNHQRKNLKVNMDIKIFKDNLKELKLQRNYSLCLNIFLSLVVILSLTIVIKKSNLVSTVVIPAGLNEKIEISQNGVSDSYLIQWSEFLTSLKLNVTPSNINRKQSVLLSYVDSAIYNEFKAHLSDEIDKVQKDEISTVFFPTDSKVVNKEKMTTMVTGVLRVYIGNEINSESQISYQLQYKLNNNNLLLTSFKESANA